MYRLHKQVIDKHESLKRKSNWIFTEKLRKGSGAGYKDWGRDIAS